MEEGSNENKVYCADCNGMVDGPMEKHKQEVHGGDQGMGGQDESGDMGGMNGGDMSGGDEEEKM